MDGERQLTANMLWLCIDNIDNVTISGHLYAASNKEGIVFYDINQLFLIGNRLLDLAGAPQAFQHIRSFKEEERTKHFDVQNRKFIPAGDAVMKQRGNVYTCIIKIVTRQHATWQGEILDESFHYLYEFQDVVEMLDKLELISRLKK